MQVPRTPWNIFELKSIFQSNGFTCLLTEG